MDMEETLREWIYNFDKTSYIEEAMNDAKKTYDLYRQTVRDYDNKKIYDSFSNNSDDIPEDIKSFK